LKNVQLARRMHDPFDVYDTCSFVRHARVRYATMTFDDADEVVTAIVWKVHHMDPSLDILPDLRQTYCMLGSDKMAFENWVRSTL